MASRSFLDLWIPGAGEPVVPATGGFRSWMAATGVGIEAAVVIVPEPEPEVQAPQAGGFFIGVEVPLRSRARVYHPAADPMRAGARLRGTARYRPAIKRPAVAPVGIAVGLSGRARAESIIRAARADDDELLELGIL